MKSDVIRKWSYSTEEWNEFVQIERSNKKEDSLYFGIGIVILGTLGLIFFRNTSLWTGLLFSIPFAILIPILRMTFSYTHLKRGISDPSVAFHPDFIEVNGKKIELISSTKRIKSIKIIDVKNSTRQFLEFDIQWITRKGPTHDEFRFLIPKDRMEEVQHIIHSYTHSHIKKTSIMKNLKRTFIITLLIAIASCTSNEENSASCDTVCEYTLASGETAATVPSELDGTYTLTYGFEQPGSPFTDGTMGTFTLMNNELTVEIDGFECITLRNPVFIGSGNYKFKDDCRDNIGYNVSANTNGSFNEINIEPLDQGFFGQFHQ
jgi:hypothetical protein